MTDRMPHASISYYDILQVPKDASDDQVRKAFHKLAKRFHPDKNPQERKLSELRFKLINEAYLHLKTHEQRQRYKKILSSRKRSMWQKKADNDNTRTASMNKTPQTNWVASFFHAFWPDSKKN